jgi:hypothetical protein
MTTALTACIALAIVAVGGASPESPVQPGAPSQAAQAQTTQAQTADDPMDRQRMQGFLSAGDTAVVAAIFRRHPSRCLPFIDSYLEGGMKLLETQGPSATGEVLQSYRMGLSFAKIADQVFGTEAFTMYAGSFASWSADERASFREGQRLFREARRTAATDRAAALSMLRDSLRRTTTLGDTWGQAMALQGLGDLLARNGTAEERLEADALVSRAAALYEPLAMRNDEIECIRLRASMSTGDGAGAGSSGASISKTASSKDPDSDRIRLLRRAWSTAVATPNVDLELARGVAAELATALEEAKNPAGAAAVRLQVERLLPPATN